VVLIIGLTVLVILAALLLGAVLAVRREAAEAADLAVATAATVTGLDHRLRQVEQEIRIILESGTSPAVIPATVVRHPVSPNPRKGPSDD